MIGGTRAQKSYVFFLQIRIANYTFESMGRSLGVDKNDKIFRSAKKSEAINNMPWLIILFMFCLLMLLFFWIDIAKKSLR